ncbi:hypothetical protein ACFE04_022205 [Oxalis oulophora]
MHDSIGIPTCFSSSEKDTDDAPATFTRSGQNVFMSVYRTKLAGYCRLITITWCKNLLLHGLSVSVQGPDGDEEIYQCKVELKPWSFWRKQGSKQFTVDERTVDVVWDLRAAKFNGETEPRSNYYVALVCEEEVVLLLGDLKKDAYKRTRCRPSLIEPILVSRKEHVFGKKRFLTRVNFQEKGTKFHDISIECNTIVNNKDKSFDGFDLVLEIRVDGHIAILVKHLQWKFRGNECIHINEHKVEVYWDVHDWLFEFGSNPRHGLFIFKPVSSAPSLRPSPFSSFLTLTQFAEPEEENIDRNESSSKFCLFLYAWKVE